MPRLLRAESLAAALVLLVAVADAARAQEAMAWVDCDAAAGRLVIEFRPGDFAGRYEGPADHEVDFYALLELDADGKTVVATHDISVACRIGDEELVATLSPMISNVNLLGRCGAAISGMLDVTRAGIAVVDDLAFEDEDCFAREDDFVERVTLRAGADRAGIVRRRYSTESKVEGAVAP